jgi:hypothetical protein
VRGAADLSTTAGAGVIETAATRVTQEIASADRKLLIEKLHVVRSEVEPRARPRSRRRRARKTPGEALSRALR